jgi:hypothetical protein
MKLGNRQYRSLNVSNSRWKAYAVASLATASGGAISAEGAIHYSGLVNFKFEETCGGVFKHTFPLSQGAILSGARDAFGCGNDFDSSATFLIKGAAVSNHFRAVLHTFYHSNPAAALPRGAVVSQGDFGSGLGTNVGRMQDAYCDFPGWQEAGTYYIGFRFNSGPGVQYGWMRIRWGGCGYPGVNKYIVKDYAWGDPGDQIKTGQRQLHEDETASPAAKSADAVRLSGSQGSLALLALGAVGLQAWRKSWFGRL